MATNDRIFQRTSETGVAFRADVKGLPFIQNIGPPRELDRQTDAESDGSRSLETHDV